MTRGTPNLPGDMGMALSLSPSQAFVQDPEGKTNVLLFHPQDSTAKNLLCHSSQLHLPPLMELYILSGSHIIQADCTGTESGLHHDPHLKILLRCRGGMRAGLRGSAYGGSGGKGRGYRAPEGDARQIGGPHVNTESSHTTPPARDKAEVEETDPSKLNVQRWFIRKYKNPWTTIASAPC